MVRKKVSNYKRRLALGREVDESFDWNGKPETEDDEDFDPKAE